MSEIMEVSTRSMSETPTFFQSCLFGVPELVKSLLSDLPYSGRQTCTFFASAKLTGS